MSFLDEVIITVEGGKGGAGCVSFHREKFQPKGGPDGGDGGDGGDVYIIADETLNNLNTFLSRQYFRAGDGEPGKGQKKHGKRGKDLLIKVPVGTVILDRITGEVIEELNFPGKKVLIARGGKGGLGNPHFASSTNQTPRYAQPGLPGERKEILLNLKIIADAGIVGFPNAGKSTLLKALTSQDPKIADYPFSTLNPNLGVLFWNASPYEERRLIIADIPGIIEGASRGAGLGISFLKHIERVSVIIYLLDINSLHLASEYRILRKELEQYSPKLLQKKSMIVFNKIDLVDYDEDIIRSIYQEFLNEVRTFQSGVEEIPVHFISAKDSVENKSNLHEFVASLFSFFPEKTYGEILAVKRYL